MSPDPTLPHSFPRRVLVGVVGLTPQVVTETLWALAFASAPPFVPSELHLVTTREGKERAELTLLDPRKGALHRLAADWPGHGFEALPAATRLHLLTDETGAPLADVTSLEANARLADLLTDLVRSLTADPRAALHVSLAGGRKTMGFLAGYALSLFGRPQDRLSHVLVDPAFEQHPQFFYPPPEPEVLYSPRDNRPMRTDRANIVLAEIPFVRLREGLPRDLLEGRASFAQAVASLQERFRPPELVMDLERGEVRAHGRPIRCPPIELAFWAWLAERRVALGDEAALTKGDEKALDRFRELYRRVAGAERAERTKAALDADPKKAWVSERVARLNNIVERELGPVAPLYRIETIGRRPRSAWRLSTPPEAIRLNGLPQETSPA